MIQEGDGSRGVATPDSDSLRTKASAELVDAPRGRRRIVIIGAGVAGLSAAYGAHQADPEAEILVLERGAEVGGKAQTLRRDGWLIENGPGSFTNTEAPFLEMLQQVGHERMPASAASARRFIYHGGSMKEVAAHPLRFLRSGLLSPLGILRVAREPWVPRREPAGVAEPTTARPHDSRSGAAETPNRLGAVDEESLWSFAARRLGPEAADRLIAPMALGVYAGDAKRLSVNAAFPRVVALEEAHGSLVRGAIALKKKARAARRASGNAAPVQAKNGSAAGPGISSFAQGMQSLPRLLASLPGIEVRCGITVCRIHYDSHGASEPNGGLRTPAGATLSRDGAAQPSDGARSREGGARSREGAQSPDRAPQSSDGAPSRDGAPQASEGATQSCEGAMQSREGATQSRGTTQPREGTTVFRTSRTREQAPRSFRIETSTGEAWDADALVVATEPHAAAELLRGLDSEFSRELSAIPCPPVAVVALGFDPSVAAAAPVGFGALVCRGEGVRMLGALWESHIFGARAPKDHLLVRTMFGGAVDPDAARLDDDALIQLARTELERVTGIKGTPVLTHVRKWERAIPQYEVGHLARVSRIETRLERYPGLYLAGNGLRGVSFARASADGLAQGARAASFALASGK